MRARIVFLIITSCICGTDIIGCAAAIACQRPEQFVLFLSLVLILSFSIGWNYSQISRELTLKEVLLNLNSAVNESQSQTIRNLQKQIRDLS